MITLSGLKKVLQRKKVISREGIMRHFHAEESDVIMLMNHFIHQGKVREKTLKPNCGTACNQCGMAKVCLYQWCAI